jgi:hypothetical protein
MNSWEKMPAEPWMKRGEVSPVTPEGDERGKAHAVRITPTVLTALGVC